jgi:hypothetical protein
VNNLSRPKLVYVSQLLNIHGNGFSNVNYMVQRNHNFIVHMEKPPFFSMHYFSDDTIENFLDFFRRAYYRNSRSEFLGFVFYPSKEYRGGTC